MKCWFCGKEGALVEYVMPEKPDGISFEAHEECPKKYGIGGELIRKPQ